MDLCGLSSVLDLRVFCPLVHSILFQKPRLREEITSKHSIWEQAPGVLHGNLAYSRGLASDSQAA